MYVEAAIDSKTGDFILDQRRFLKHSAPQYAAYLSIGPWQDVHQTVFDAACEGVPFNEGLG